MKLFQFLGTETSSMGGVVVGIFVISFEGAMSTSLA